MKIQIKLLIIFMLFLILTCFVLRVQAEESTTVTVVGVSESFESMRLRARDEAFRDAYRRAIEKGARNTHKV